MFLGSIVVSIPACHAGDRGSIPRRGESFFLDVLDEKTCMTALKSWPKEKTLLYITFSSFFFQLNVTADQWFKNVLNTDKFSNYQTYTKLGKPVDRHQ